VVGISFVSFISFSIGSLSYEVGGSAVDSFWSFFSFANALALDGLNTPSVGCSGCFFLEGDLSLDFVLLVFCDLRLLLSVLFGDLLFDFFKSPSPLFDVGVVAVGVVALVTFFFGDFVVFDFSF